MSRTLRATIAAGFGYVRFGFAIVAGLWLVPCTLEHVGANRYGYWLASGELLAYAALTEFGVLTTLPWLIAEADGVGDRDRVRELLSTGAAAASLSAGACAAAVFGLWWLLPSVVHLSPAARSDVIGPVLLLAVAGVVAHPMRVFPALLTGLQDVRFTGITDLGILVVNAALTIVLLQQGYGLYALAIADGAPALLYGFWNLYRVHVIAPDLLRGWRRPHWGPIRRLFGEGMGAWIGGWGWRLISASDGLVLAALGHPSAIAALACTNKLAQAFTQLSWVPCDSGLVGLSQLAGEQRGPRLREAIVVMVRVYLTMAGTVACIVLAANPAFVTRWVGFNYYAGWKANTLIAILAVTMTFGHALSVVSSVLGQRMQIGVATLIAGVLHVALAFGLGLPFGIFGVLLAGVLSHGLVFSALAWRPFARATGMADTTLLTDVLGPWASRLVVPIFVAVALQNVAGTPPLLVTIAMGGLVGLFSMWHMRPLYMSFGPVRALYDRVFRRWQFRGAPGEGAA